MLKNKVPEYLQLYGLKQAPFRLSPDPYFYFPTSTHAMAEKILSHSLENNEGFMVLTGSAGLGKTLLLRRIMTALGKEKILALILSSAVSPLGLLQLLLSELGENVTGEESEAILLQMFQDKILSIAQNSQEVLIVVDEAQNMPISTLEQLRMLSNLETGSRKLLQIILVGQEGLNDILLAPELGQLAQRIVIHEKLRPLTFKETSQYIAYRFKMAGREDFWLTNIAAKQLFSASKGVPRLINKIMDRTLLVASDRIPSIITRKDICNATSTMQYMTTGCGNRKRGVQLVVLSVVVLFLSLLVFLLPARLSAYSQDETTQFVSDIRLLPLSYSSEVLT